MSDSTLPEECRGVVYAATSSTSGRSYVGSTVNAFADRQKRHLRDAKAGSKTHFHCAIRKYGAKDFSWEVLEECVGHVELRSSEARWIESLGSYPHGYNMTPHGLGAAPGLTGYERTEEHREALRQRSLGNTYTKGSHLTESTKALLAASHLGTHHTEEAKERMRAVHIAMVTDEDRERSRRTSLGRKHTEESKAKMRASAMGNTYNLGLKRSPEQIATAVAGRAAARARRLMVPAPADQMMNGGGV